MMAIPEINASANAYRTSCLRRKRKMQMIKWAEGRKGRKRLGIYDEDLNEYEIVLPYRFHGHWRVYKWEGKWELEVYFSRSKVKVPIIRTKRLTSARKAVELWESVFIGSPWHVLEWWANNPRHPHHQQVFEEVIKWREQIDRECRC